MKEIKCPKCGTVFTIDEGSYNEILEQVRKNHLDEEIEKTKKAVEEKYIAILYKKPSARPLQSQHHRRACRFRHGLFLHQGQQRRPLPCQP